MMAEKSKSKIGGIGKFATFGGGDTKTSKQEDMQTLTPQQVQTQETKDVQTSTGDGQKDVRTYEHFNGDDPWSEDATTQTHQDVQTSIETDAKVVEVEDIRLLGGPVPAAMPDEDVLTLTRHSHIASGTQDEETSITGRPEDVQTSSISNSPTSISKDARTPQLQNSATSSPQNAPMSISLSVHEQLRQDEETSKQEDVPKKRGARSPEKEEGRQTVYFNDPRQRRVLMALKFLERRDIGDIVSDALDLYVEQSPFKSVLPAFLAAQEGNLPEH
jgi:hypothetical protein